MRRLPLALALLAPAPTVALRRAAPDAAAPALAADVLVDSTFGTDANATTKFLFLTHHKTGTNLAIQLCNLTAQILSDGKEMCHWCYKALKQNADGSLRCPADDESAHGPYRGTGGRFTMISTVDSSDLGLMRAWAPDYRAVHMVRDPVKMLVSDYQYNIGLYKKHSKQLWDATMKRTVFYGSSFEDKLRNVSYAMSHFVDHMCKVREATKGDPHMIEIDLESFQSSYDQTTRRLFSFLYGAGHPKMDELVERAAEWDIKREKRLQLESYVSNHSEAPAAERKVREMMQAGDETILASTSCEGAKKARPWAGKVRHPGNSNRSDAEMNH